MKKQFTFVFLFTLGVSSVFAQTGGINMDYSGYTQGAGNIYDESANQNSNQDINSGTSKAVNSAKDVSSDVQDAQDSDVPSKIDASGNLTLRINETYKTSVNLPSGNLIMKEGSSVLKDVTVGGDVKLDANVSIKGNLIVKGNLVVSDNVDIGGGISSKNLSAGANFNVNGPINISSTETIIIGDNADITGTLTSKAGLSIGVNSDVKLFLSGESSEIDGKVYKMGGKIIKSGANASVGLPFVPKLKNSDGSAPLVTQNEKVALPVTISNKKGEKQNTSEVKSEKVNSAENANQDNNSETSDYEDSFSSDPYIGTLPSVDTVMNANDLNAYVSKVSGLETKVSDLNLNSENVEMKYDVPASLFGFIPASLPTNVKVSKDKNVDVSFPWYSFLFSKQTNEDAIKQNISTSLSSSFTENQNVLSEKMQASITNSILGSLKGMFGGK